MDERRRFIQERRDLPRRSSHVAQLWTLGVMSETSKKFPRWTVATLATAVLGNLLAALVPIFTLLMMSRGSSGRLMADSALDFLIAVATLFSVPVLAIISIIKDRPRIMAICIVIIAFGLALTPFFFSGWVMQRVAEMRNITLED